MPRPFVAYLRVYEPLSSFDAELSKRLQRVIDSGRLDHSAVGEHEQRMWLKSQLAAPPILLPAELSDGRPSPAAIKDVLVLDPADVPTTPDSSVGTEPLICPLDLRARSAAALVGFMANASPALRSDTVVAASQEKIRARASEILGDQRSGAVHVVSTTWTVPLPWFALVDPEQHHLVVATQNDPARRSCWRVAMLDARKRVARAHTLATRTFGEQGPAKVLADTAGWLGNFDQYSAVELDYGGLVQLMDDEQLVNDTSAADVNAIIDAIDSDDAPEVAARFERLRDFWSDLAVRERFN